MAFFHFKNVRVAGIAAGVPDNVVSNLDSERQISKEYDNAHFVATTGVKERRVTFTLTTSDLCFAAAKKLLADLNWDAKEIDAIIMVSQTLDFILPATACIMQDKLGCSKECFAQDIQLGCSGWVYGLSNLAAMLQNGDIRKALLCAGDARGQFVNPAKADPLFGSAGTVTALEFDEGNPGFFCHYGTDGSGYEAIIKHQGGARNPLTASSLEYKLESDGKTYNGLTTHMNGMDVFSFGITTAPKSVKKLGERYDFDYSEADHFVFHQANMKMNLMINKKLKLKEGQALSCMDVFGNTSSASIPLTIVHHFGGSTVDNKKFICCGFGVGLSWGTVAFTARNTYVASLVEVASEEHMI